MLFPEISRDRRSGSIEKSICETRIYVRSGIRWEKSCVRCGISALVITWEGGTRKGLSAPCNVRAYVCIYIYICIFILVSSADGWFITQWLRPRYRGPLRNQFQIAAGEDRWKREAYWDGEARWIILPQPGLTEQRANLEIMQYRAETLGILKTCTIIASLKTYVAINAYSSSSPRMF